MKITQKNMDDLRAMRHESFRVAVLELLRQEYTHHPAARTDQERLRYIEAGILKARKYDIPLGPGTAKLIFLMLELSPSFDEDPRWGWAKAILETRIANKADRLVAAALLVLEDKPLPIR